MRIIDKAICVVLLSLIGTLQVHSQALATGDIMFVGFNTDGDDDFAIVALRDITNETIFFTDKTVATIAGNAEGTLQWDTGPVTIAAGCVVVFSDAVDDGARTASIGTFSEAENGFNITAGGDGILAYTGTAWDMPSVYLAGIENSVGAIGDLTGTGLDACTAPTITNGVSDDAAQYDGPRNTESAFADYKDSLKVVSNWETETSNGENILPFSTVKFTLAGPMCTTAAITGRDTTICPGETVDLKTLLSGTFSGGLKYGTTFGTYPDTISTTVAPIATMTYFIQDSVAGTSCVDTAMITVSIMDCTPPCDIEATFASTQCNADGTYSVKVTVDSTNALSDMLIAFIDGTPSDTLAYPSTDGGEICIKSGLVGDGTSGVQLILADSALSSVMVWGEDFETNGNGSRYTTSTPEFSDGDSDFFGRTNNPLYGVTGSSGNFFFAGEDINSGGPATDTLMITGIDISSIRDLKFKGLFAEEDASDGNEDWNTSDALIIQAQIDGGGYNTIMQFSDSGSNNSEPKQDLDFDGIGEGAPLTSTFTEFQASIPSTGSTLDLIVIFDRLDAGDEDAAIDNLMIMGNTYMCADTITYDEPTTANITGRDTTICSGETLDLKNFLSGTFVGGLKYGTTFGTYPDTITTTVSPASTMTYFVQDIDGSSMCMDTAMITVNVITKPIITGKDTTICSGETVDLKTLLSGTFAGGLKYSTAFGTYPDTITSTVTPPSTMTYFIQDSVEGSLCMDTAMITVNVITNPIITGKDTTICSGETVDLKTLLSGMFSGGLKYGSAFGTYPDTITATVTPPSTMTYFIQDSVEGSLCMDTAMITINVITNPIITGKDTTICSGETVDLKTLLSGTFAGGLNYGTAFGTYSDTITTTVTPPSTMTYFIQDSVAGSLCMDTAMITINVITNPIITGKDTTICSGETIDLKTLLSGTFAGGLKYGTAFGTYTDTITASVTPPSTVTYFIQDSVAGSLCMDTAMITVNVITNPIITGKDTTICSGETVDLKTLLSGTLAGGLKYGTAFGTYTDTITATVTPPSTMTYFIKDSVAGSLCMDTAMITVNVITNPIITGKDTTICSGETVDLKTLLSGTFAGELKYGTAFGTYPDTITATVTPPSTMTYFIQDSVAGSLCMDTAMITVNVITNPIITGKDTTICSGETVDLKTLLSGTFAGGLNYGTAFGTYPDTITATVTPPSTMTYFIQDSVAGSLCMDTAMITVNVITNPIISGKDTTICSGETVDLKTLLSGTFAGELKYGTAFGTYPDTITATVTPPSTMTYFIQDSVAGSLCMDTAMITVNVITNPIITGKDTTICSGETVDLKTLLSGTFAGGLNYGTAFGTYPDTITATVTPPSTMTYFIQDSVAGSLCMDTAMITVNVITNPIISGKDTTICSGETVDLKTLLSGTFAGGLKYGTTFGTYPDTITATVTPVSTMTYFVQDIDGSSMCMDTAMITVNVITNPIITGKDTTICSGETVDLKTLLSGTFAGGLKYGTAFGTYTDTITATVTPPSTMTYFIQDSVAGSLCMDTAMITVNVITSPIITGKDTTICSGETVDLKTLLSGTLAGGLNYGTAFGTYSDTITTTVTPPTTTTYFIQDSVAGSLCMDTAMITVNVITNPIITGKDTTICSGETVDLKTLLSSTFSGGLKYGTAFGTYPDTITTSVAPSTTMTYFIQDSVAGSLCMDTAMITVNVITNPIITGKDTTICSGETIDLKTLLSGTFAGGLKYGTAFGTYPDTITTTITPPSTMTYFIQDNVAGSLCMDTAMITVNVITSPIITGKDTTICSGETVDLKTLLSGTFAGELKYGTAFGTYPDTITATVTPPSTMTYFIQDSVAGSLCMDTAMITVNVITSPIITGKDTTICSGETVDLKTLLSGTFAGELKYGTAFGTYPDTITATVTPPSTMTYFIQDSVAGSLCMDTAMITVNVITNPIITGKDTTICSGETVDLKTLLSGTFAGELKYGTAFGTYPDTITATVTPPSTMTYFIQDSVAGSLCMDTAMITVNVITNPIITGKDTTICSGETIDLKTLLSGTFSGGLKYGTAFGTYPDTITATVTPPSTMTYFIQDSVAGSLCMDTAMITVNVITNPIITGKDTTICSSENVDLKTLLSGTFSGGLKYGTAFGTYLDTITTTITPPSTTTYFIQDSLAGSLCMDTAMITINVITNPIITGKDTTICSGETVDLKTLLSGTFAGGLNYGTAFGTYSDTITTTVTPPTTTTYFIQDSVAGSLCMDTAMITVNVITNPIITGKDTTICSGETVDLKTLLSGTFAGGLKYGTAFGTYPDTITTTITPPSTMTYFIQDSVAGSLCMDTAMITVNVITNPIITGKDTTICSGETIDLKPLLSGTFAGGLKYGTAFGTYPDTITTTITPPSTMTYFIQDSVAGSLCMDTAMITVNVITNPIITGKDTTICSGEIVGLKTLLSGTFAGGLKYGTAFGTYTDTITATVTPPSTMTYFIQDSVAGSLCMDTAMITVNVITNPIITGKDTTICSGETVDLKTLLSGTFAGGLNYGTAFGTYPDTITATVTPPSTMTYFIQDSVAGSLCMDTAMITVNVITNPIISGKDTTICSGETVDLKTLLSGTFAGGLKYGTAFGTYTDTITATVTPPSTMTYFIQDSVAGSLCMDTAMITVNVITNPIITGKDTTICSGETVDLKTLLSGTFAGGLKYGTAFGTYTDTITATVTPPSTMTYFIQDSVAGSLCMDTAMITVNVITNPIISGKDTIICSGETVDLKTLLSGTFAGGLKYGTAFGTYSDTITTTVTPPSTMTYFIQDSVAGSLCMDTAMITVTIMDCTPPCDIEATFASTECNADGTYSLKVTVDSTDALSDMLVALIDGVPSDTLAYPAADGGEICIETGLVGDGTSGVQLILADSALSSIMVWGEDFETDGNGSRYSTSTPEFSDGDSDFFGRTNNPLYGVTGSSGNFFFAGEDINSGGPATDTLMITGIDISSIRDLKFKGLFAEEDASDGNEDWNTSDALIIQAQIDGGGYNTIMQFSDSGTNNSEPKQDLDFDGIGEGAPLNSTFTEYQASIPSTGSSLDLIVIFDRLDAGDEDAAIDNLMIMGRTYMCADTITYDEPTTANITGRDTTICSGEALNLKNFLSGTFVGGLKYGTTFGTYSDTITTTVSPASTITYFVQDIDGSSMCMDTAMITVTVITNPIISGKDTTICNGETVDLKTLLSGTFSGGLKYGTAFGTYTDTITTTVTPPSTMTYFIQDSVAGSLCLDTTMITVNVITNPIITGKDTTICPGEPVDLKTLLSGTFTGGLKYGTAFGTYPDTITTSVAPSTTTTYFIQDSVAGALCMDTAMITVTIMDCTPPCDIEATFASTECNADGTYSLKVTVDSTYALSDMLVAIIDGTPSDTLAYPAADGGEICIETGLKGDGTTGVQLILADSALSSVMVWGEDFETDGNGSRYTTSTPEFSDGASDFFGRTDNSSYGVTGSSGNSFFAGEDINSGSRPATDTLMITGIDISSIRDLKFKGLFAEEDASDENEDWNTSDALIIQAQIDGGGYNTIMQFSDSGTNNSEPKQDLDFDGIGEGAPLTSTFTEFQASIPSTGSSLDLIVIFDRLDAADEDAAIDNLMIMGRTYMCADTITYDEPTCKLSTIATIGDPCDCCNPDNIDLDGDDLPDIFKETVSISSNPSETWNITSNTGVLDINGSPASSVSFVEGPAGTYIGMFYHQSPTGYTASFSNGITTLMSSNSCAVCTSLPAVPDPKAADIALCSEGAKPTTIIPTQSDPNVLLEDFETDGLGTRYFLDRDTFTTFGDPNISSDGSHFFTRTDETNIASAFNYGNPQGTHWWAASNIDISDSLSPSATMIIPAQGIVGLCELDFSVYLAEDDVGSSEHWNNEDFLHFDYSIDGGAFQPLLWIESDGGRAGSAPYVDTDFDGIGDGTEVTDIFQSFSAAIADVGDSITIRISMYLDASNEDIAFDNIMISGVPVTYNFYDADPATGGVLLAANVRSYDPLVTLANSPQTVWVQSNCGGCNGEALPVIIGIHPEGEISLPCHDEVYISIGDDCDFDDVKLTSFYTGEIEPIYFDIHLKTEDHELVDLDSLHPFVGERLKYEVIDTCGRNSCWGYVYIEDKLPPVAKECPCEISDISALSAASAPDSCKLFCYDSIYFQEPLFMDNCLLGMTADTMGIYVVTDSIELECDTILVTRSWIFKDTIHDKTREHTICTQAFYHLPIDHDQILWPSKKQVLACDSVSLHAPVDSIAKAYGKYFAGPHVINNIGDTILLTDDSLKCHIPISYTDNFIQTCAHESQIARTWRLLDWCTQTYYDSIRIIDVKDKRAPDFGVIEVEAEIINERTLVVDGDTLTPEQAQLLIEIDLDKLFRILEVREFDCTVDFEIPIFEKLSDNCSPVDLIDLEYSIDAEGAIFDSENPRLISNIPNGKSEITIVATDECGNFQNHNLTLIVLDKAPPVMICKDTISTVLIDTDFLADGGISQIPVEAFDLDSYDECGELLLMLGKRLDNKFICGGRPLSFISTEYIEFCCEDVGQYVPVELTIFDNGGNQGKCISHVLVENKSKPRLTCENVTISCNDPIHPKWLGYPHVSQACAYVDTLTYEDDYDVDELCFKGQIIRKWSFYEQDISCYQTITILDNDDGSSSAQFNPRSIKWPLHYNGQSLKQSSIKAEHVYIKDRNAHDECIESKLSGSSLDINTILLEMGMNPSSECISASYSEPTWEDPDCGLIGKTFQDSEFAFNGNVCKNIIREWVVIDWCAYDSKVGDLYDEGHEYVNDLCNSEAYFRIKASQNEKDGYYKFVQEIVITDQTPPVITADDKVLVEIDGGGKQNSNPCEQEVTVSAAASDFCGADRADQAELKWYVQVLKIDTLEQTETIIPNAQGQVWRPLTAGQSSDVEYQITGLPNEIYHLKWRVIDGCNNRSEEVTKVYFKDVKAPQIICHGSISTHMLKSDGSVEIWALDLAKAYDCNGAEVDVWFKNENGQYIPNLAITCSDMGGSQDIAFDIKIYAVDHDGNESHCITQVSIHDESMPCARSGANIFGTVSTFGDHEIETTLVSMTDQSMMTGVDGSYYFSGNVMNKEYELTFAKNDDLLNGVSALDVLLIQKHILGLSPLEQHYQKVAADINNDGIINVRDLISLRRAILGLDSAFPNNHSWRFTNADEPFTQLGSAVPHLEDDILINTLSLNNEQNVKGIKVGDISGDVRPNSLVTSSRSQYTVSLLTQDVMLKKGVVTELEFRMSENVNIDAFELYMDHNMIRVISTANGRNMISNQNIYSHNNTSTIVWTKYDQDSENQSIRITVIPSQDAHLSEMISVNKRSTAYDDNEKDYRIALDFEKVGVFENIMDSKFSPNPWSSDAVITVMMPQSDVVNILLHDSAGKIINEEQKTLKAGLNKIHLSDINLDKSGIIYYYISSESAITSGKTIYISR